MLELCKPTETVQILAQFNPTSEFSIYQCSLFVRHMLKGVGDLFSPPCPLFVRAMHRFGEECFSLLLILLWTAKFRNSLVQGLADQENHLPPIYGKVLQPHQN